MEHAGNSPAASGVASGVKPQVRLRLVKPHLGQKRIIDGRGRFNVIRCGRRFGKTTMAEYLAARVMLSGPDQPVGWFVPEYEYMLMPWRNINAALAPLIRSSNKNEHRIELVNGSSVQFWSCESNPDAGRGYKFRRAIFDEAGLNMLLQPVFEGSVSPAIADMWGDVWVFGTPNPVVKFFRQLFNRGGIDPEWRSFRARTEDNPFIDADEIANRRASMPEWLARQEFDGEDIESDAMFFSSQVLEGIRAGQCLDPAWWATIICTANDRSEAIQSRALRTFSVRKDDFKGAWKFYTDLVWDRDGRIMRPDQRRAYVMGVDLSYGVGASNTVFCVVDADSGEQIAEYACPGVNPEEAAKAAAIAGYWLGGRTESAALINFEANGPGQMFAREILRLGYQKVMRRNVSGDARIDTGAIESDKIGWNSSPKTKWDAFSTLRADMCEGRIVVRSDQTISELAGYVVDELGSIKSPYDLRTNFDAPEGARTPHGDRGVALALANLARRAVCGSVTIDPPPRGAPTSVYRSQNR